MTQSKLKLLFLIISNSEGNYYLQEYLISMSETNQMHEVAVSLHESSLKSDLGWWITEIWHSDQNFKGQSEISFFDFWTKQRKSFIIFWKSSSVLNVQ